MYQRHDAVYGHADHLAVYGSSDEFAARYFARCFGLGAEHEEAIRIEYLELVAALLEEGVPTRPGAHELIGALRGLVPLGLATNTRRPLVDVILRRSGLAGAFDQETTGDEGRPKPEPDIYLLVCERLGVAPENAVALEDSPFGVQAAKAAGMTCIGVPSEPTADLARADRIVASLHELL
jgi:HAD superfamily hydrolase (TIGR01509 family)